MKTVGRYGGRAVGLAVLLLTALPPFRLSAQGDPRLAEAIRLAGDGRGDSARAMVRGLLTRLSPADSVYPEALYTAGILAGDASEAQRHLQRVAIEYSLSPWADDALYRLAQLYYAQADPATTAQTVARLRREYPGSPVLPRAAFWGARAYFDLRDQENGCDLLRVALDGAGADIEFKNQVSYYAGRCATTAVIPTDSATRAGGGVPPAPTPRPGDTTQRPPPVAYSVQVLAVRNATQVDDMLTRLRVMGYQGHVLRDTDGLLKVRVGRYPNRQEAQAAAQRLKTRLGGQPFVVEEW
jgi:sporulation related protein